MKTETAPFINAVQAVSQLTKRRTLPILGSILIGAKGGRLTLATTDLDQWCERSLPCEGDLEPCCVAAPRLAMNPVADSLTLTRDNGWLQIDGGGTIKVATLKADEFVPRPASEKLLKIGVNCSDLADCIDGVAWACHKDAITWPERAAVHVVLSDKEITTEAYCGPLFAKIAKAAIAASAELLIPTVAIRGFVAALRDAGAVLSVAENYVQVEGDSGAFLCKQVDKKYPNTAPLVKAKRDPLGPVSPTELLPALQQCQLMQLDIWRSLALGFSKAGVEVAFQNSQGETFRRQIPGHKFNDCQIHVSPDAIAEALKHCSGDASLAHDGQSISIQSGDLFVLTQKVTPS